MICAPLLAVLVTIPAVSKPPASADLRLGPWRAVLASPGGELPFGLDLTREGDTLTATIVNGSERIAIPRATYSDGQLLLDLEHYDSTIRARGSADGSRLEGLWRKRVGEERWAQLPFTATAGRAPRFESVPETAAGHPDGAAITGRWAVRFASSEDGAVGVFAVDADGGASGTFLTTTGDYRFLAGSFEGDRLRLSCFDGAHAFLFDARLGADGTLAGGFWSRDSWHEAWTARRDASAALPDAFRQTRWTGKVRLEDLAFPDPSGTRRSLADPAFAGKVRIVQVFGTWCPNCHDETAYLVELDRRFGKRGLAILGLAFEVTEDFERNARQVRRFERRHGVRYPILVAGPSDKAAATKVFPAVDRIRSYPTTIFLDHAGRVRAVHSGFAGPATGKAHERLRVEFEGLIEELLAEAERDSE